MSQEDLTNEQGSQPDPLTMSDEAFANLDPSEFEQWDEPAGDDESQETEDFSDTDSSDDSMNSDEDQDPEDEPSEDDAESQDEAEDDEDGEADQDQEDNDDAEDADDADDSESEEDADEENEDDTDSEEESDDVDYKAEYEKLLATFKANGREMQVKNVDEARRLMQMGANYNKKMAALKPSLKTVKLLDKHGLNDESKLGHLIDLTRGDKGAIQKLLKDAGVDPMDLDTEQESDYRPNTYNVDERELELDEVLDSLQDTPTYSQTVDLVSNKWDDASKQIIANNPRVLEVLNDQMANGVYERVSTEVERLRAFGQLTGVSDIEAYKSVGDRMAAEGKFDDLAQGSQSTQPSPKKPTRKARTKKPDPKLSQKKRAASTTRTKPASKAPADFNPLGMSDEEFEKQFDSNLL